jgi:hypothetical protein
VSGNNGYFPAFSFFCAFTNLIDEISQSSSTRRSGGLADGRKIPVISARYVNQSAEVNMNACTGYCWEHGTPDTKVAIAHPPHFDLGQKKKPGERPGLKGEERKKKIHQIMLR